MLRRLVRGYYSLRYFPRRLFAVLTQLSLQMTALEQGRAQALRQGGATLADIEAGIGAFCDDATRAMLGLDRSIAAASGRMSQVHRTLMRAEAAHQESSGSLDAMRRAVEQVCDQTSSMRAALARFAEAQPASTPAAAKRLAAMLGPVAPGAGSLEPDAGVDGVRAAVSVGVAGDVGWDVDVASRGIPVWQFDPTVPGPSPSSPLFTFERVAVVGAGAGDGITLDAVLKTRIPPGSGSLMLKLNMDLCDGSLVSTADELALRSFSTVVLRFHKLDRLDDEAIRASVAQALTRLTKTHAVQSARVDGCVDLLTEQAMTPSSAEIRFRLRGDLAQVSDPPATTTMTYLHRTDRRDEPTHIGADVSVHDAAAD